MTKASSFPIMTFVYDGLVHRQRVLLEHLIHAAATPGTKIGTMPRCGAAGERLVDVVTVTEDTPVTCVVCMTRDLGP